MILGFLKKNLLLILSLLKFKHKILITYIVLIIVLLGSYSIYSFSKISKINQSNIIKTTNQITEKIKTFIEFKIQYAGDISDMISKDSKVRQILSKNIANYSKSSQIDDMNYLRVYLNNLESSNQIYRVRIFLREGLVYTSDMYNFYPISQIIDTEWYHRTEVNEGKIHISMNELNSLKGKNVRVLSFSRIFRDYSNDENNITAMISVDVLEDDICNILSLINTQNKSIAFITDENNNIITNNDKDNKIQDKKDKLEDYLNKMKSGNNFSSGYYTYKSENLLVNHILLQDIPWTLHTLTPLNTLVKEENKLKTDSILVLIIIGGLCYIIAFYLSKYSTKRLYQLMISMRAVKNSNFKKIDVNIKDEIGELQETFNYMVLKLENLFDEKYRMGKEVKDAELKALQAQINPHFLYNTLDLINWMAINQNAYNISELIIKLSQFYKMSLSKGKDKIKIFEELTHIELYVDIQNFRFDNKIRLIINVDDELMNYSIIKLTLQPIVENAILHGILKKSAKSGVIKIIGSLEDGKITIIIEDDGVGFSDSNIEHLSDQKQRNDFHGFGLKNIDERIKLNYGAEYGLMVKSEVGMGTKVYICIPPISIV